MEIRVMKVILQEKVNNGIQWSGSPYVGGNHYQIIAVLMLFGKYIVHGSYVCQGLNYLYWGWSSHL